MSPTLHSRILGSLHGVIIVDALGGPPQFTKRHSYPLVTTLKPNPHFDMPAGAFSDDGSMTLCLAQSLIDTSTVSTTSTTSTTNTSNSVSANRPFSLSDLIPKFVAWRWEGYLSAADYAFDVGHSTSLSLLTWRSEFARSEGGNVSRGQNTVNTRLGDERFSGNGSLMRVAPVGCWYSSDELVARWVAREQSDVTHPSSVCGDACALYTTLIIAALQGATKEDLVRKVRDEDISSQVLENRLGRYGALKDWEAMPEDKIKSSGWVVDTLEAALWCFFTTESFRDGAIRAVNLGDDTDTVGAVYGGLAGAWYGVEEIPKDWKQGIVKREMVDGVVGRFANLACQGG